MPQDIVIRILLFPLSLVYGLVVNMRSMLYRIGLLRSTKFDLPIISVGNLTVGGSGKTPHIEYLLRWLDDYIELSTLSRGYGRKTAGFRQVFTHDKAINVGDEPLQYKRKFPNVPVFVSESRVLGIPQMLKDYPNMQCILLDDAFQHLAVSPGLHILLTEHANPFTRDWLMPSGRLREGRSAYRRADIIIVTKCPEDMDTHDRFLLTREIDPFPRQRIYFSRYRYHQLYNFLAPEQRIDLQLNMNVLVVCAIAGTRYLVQHLRDHVRSVRTLEYTDHHLFEEDDIDAIIKDFKLLPPDNRIIITTEKDAMRLETFTDYIRQQQLPLFVLPVEVEFLDQDEQRFRQDIQQFLLDFKA